jgi:hypothetical protein
MQRPLLNPHAGQRTRSCSIKESSYSKDASESIVLGAFVTKRERSPTKVSALVRESHRESTNVKPVPVTVEPAANCLTCSFLKLASFGAGEQEADKHTVGTREA